MEALVVSVVVLVKGCSKIHVQGGSNMTGTDFFF